ncbi:MAG: tRNA uridine-5-carboxymethylaminomethyl(34) synthesis GTPase MnmE [Pseudomonadota bacterium]
MSDSIFAISSGSPPAAIGVIRVSGPEAGVALKRLAGRTFTPRRASLTTLRDMTGEPLDSVLVLWFPGPNTVTGEDLAELHCHGGRAVLSAVSKALAAISGLRAAEAGEFTRRAFANGRIDLAEAEGLGDLLSAETELQRAAAIQMAGGAFSAQVDAWRSEVLQLSAQIEAALDFSDEDDVSELPPQFASDLAVLSGELGQWLARPRAEKLGEGYRVVFAGPPNSGKSTLFNALIESEAAITSDIAGTTRDVIERNVAISSIPFSFVDTAGLRDRSSDTIEQIGIDRAQDQIGRADLVLWLGAESEGPAGSWEIAARKDASDFVPKASARFEVSAATGQGIAELKQALVEVARGAMPRPGEAALNARQHAVLSDAAQALRGAGQQTDLLLCAEELRQARAAFDRLIGKATTEDMLDALFGRFCIGK